MVSGADPRRTKSEAKVVDSEEYEPCWICLDDAREDLLRPCLCPRWVHARCMARWQLQCSGKHEENLCKFCDVKLPNWRGALFKDMMESDADEDTTEGDALDDDDARSIPCGTTGASPDSTRIEPDIGGLTDGTPRDGVASTPGNSRRSSSTSFDERSDIQGDIIVKFNDMSFRCKVRTGHEGLEDFMAQIREKCGIPAEKMQCLNLTYRCKDPNTGSQMTLQGVNESTFDAAVLCSAAQDKIKQRRLSKSKSDGSDTSTACKSDQGAKTKVARCGDGADTDAATNRAFRRTVDLDMERNGGASSSRDSDHGRCSSGSDGELWGGEDGCGLSDASARDADVADTDPDSEGSPAGSPVQMQRGVLESMTPRSFKRGARRLSAPPPRTSAAPNDETETRTTSASPHRRPWPRFMRAFTSK